MVCYVMLCHVRLCHVRLCCAVSCVSSTSEQLFCIRCNGNPYERLRSLTVLWTLHGKMTVGVDLSYLLTSIGPTQAINSTSYALLQMEHRSLLPKCATKTSGPIKARQTQVSSCDCVQRCVTDQRLFILRDKSSISVRSGGHVDAFPVTSRRFRSHVIGRRSGSLRWSLKRNATPENSCIDGFSSSTWKGE